jgi:hypothetical protein
MENFYLGVSIFLCLLVLLCLYRVVYGPTIIDRIVGVGAIGTKNIGGSGADGFYLWQDRDVFGYHHGLRYFELYRDISGSKVL